MKYIGLLDCNNFFVSCERLFRPDLRNKPVVVLSANDGCIVARSQEVKDKGIPMGVPLFQVKDILKDIGATTFSSHFTLYRDISRRVFSVMKDEIGLVEQYSIDEAFFCIEGEYEDVMTVIRRLKDKVERTVGIPVSIGVGLSKTQAKYASTVAKKTGGCFILEQIDWEERAEIIPLSEIWGVGGRLSQRFKVHGLQTVAQLLLVDRARLLQLFGVVGVRLQSELKGESMSPVTSLLSTQKSIMSSRSFQKETSSKSVVEDALAYHLRHITADLRAMHMKASVIKIWIRPSRFGDYFMQGAGVELCLPEPTNDTFTLLKLVSQATNTLFSPEVPYKKAGVLAAGLIPETIVQTNLFHTEAAASHAQALLGVVDSLNAKTGKEILMIGSSLKARVWQSRKDACSPAYTTQWSSIRQVQA